jgi:hypothetical protein
MGNQRSTQRQGSGDAGVKTTIDLEPVEEAYRAIERSLQGEEAWSQEMAEAVDQALELEVLAPSVQRALRGLAKGQRRGRKRILKTRRKAKRLKPRL